MLGSGELLRSTDAGRHFRRVAAPSLTAQGSIPEIVFANGEDGFAYLGGGSPLYFTHDGGRSWQRARLRGDVHALTVGGGDVYAVAGRALVRSPVSRNAWRKLPLAVSPRRVALAARGSHLWVLGPPRRSRDADTIALSSNRGRTFASRRGPCFYELGGSLAPAGGKVVWAVCPTGNFSASFRSTDGGRSFASVRTPGQTNGARISPLSAKVAVLDRGINGPLFRTTDGGRTWRRVRQPARVLGIGWIAFSTGGVGAALVNTGPSIMRLWRTTDAGATWRNVPFR